jgi:dihydroorotate dehydrogenase
MFFLADPERVHDGMTQVGIFLGKHQITQRLMRLMYGYSHPTLVQTIAGIRFPNPIGLSAGFDKDGHLMDILPDIGFGYEEIGSVTAQRSEGNSKPRLQRLKKSKSLVVYYGLKNDGALAIHKRLGQRKFRFPLGISIAKTNCKETVSLRSDSILKLGQKRKQMKHCKNSQG